MADPLLHLQVSGDNYAEMRTDLLTKASAFFDCNPSSIVVVEFHGMKSEDVRNGPIRPDHAYVGEGTVSMKADKNVVGTRQVA